MNNYQVFNRILQSLKNRQPLLVLLLILSILFLSACLSTKTAALEINDDQPLSELEPVAIDVNADDQISEPEINPLEVL